MTAYDIRVQFTTPPDDTHTLYDWKKQVAELLDRMGASPVFIDFERYDPEYGTLGVESDV